MSATGQRRYRDSAMGIALALSLIAHLPLLVFWKEASPAPPATAGGRIQLQLTAVPKEPAATARVPAPAPPEPASRPRQTKEASLSRASASAAPVAPPTPAEPPAPRIEPVRSRAESVPRSRPPLPTRPRPSAVPDTAPPPAQPETPMTGATAAREASPAPAAGETQIGAPSAGPSPARREQLQQALSRALLDHFSYPLKARRRHWEGEVVLRVTILRNGRIAAAQVDRSSGHRVLDQAALDSLSQVPALAGIALEQEMELLLPVIYRLRG